MLPPGNQFRNQIKIYALWGYPTVEMLANHGGKIIAFFYV